MKLNWSEYEIPGQMGQNGKAHGVTSTFLDNEQSHLLPQCEIGLKLFPFLPSHFDFRYSNPLLK